MCKTILLYCSKGRKDIESKNSKVVKTKNWRIMCHVHQNVPCVVVKKRDLLKSKKLVDW